MTDTNEIPATATRQSRDPTWVQLSRKTAPGFHYARPNLYLRITSPGGRRGCSATWWTAARGR